MLFVIPPVLQRAGVDRLTNLFRACGPDGTFGLMELQTGFFERQIAVVQDSSDLDLCISDDVLVLNQEDPTR